MEGHQRIGKKFLVTGSRHELGGWDLSKAVPLNETGFCVSGKIYREVTVDIPNLIKSFTYRIVGVDDRGKLMSVTEFSEGSTLPNAKTVYCQEKMMKPSTQ